MPSLVDLTSGGLLYGGDDNPEQWDRATWRDDVAAMQAAGVTMVTIGVFSWALLEPERDRFELTWMDEVLDLLHEGGIAVDLATPTASPPPWLALEDAETLPMDAGGHRLHHGSRTHYCPSSPTYRERARVITQVIAERWASHPAVVMWHVNNELGTHCWCPRCGAAFRDWLERRYGSLEKLNAAWGTAVWSQRYGAWEQIAPPLRAPYLLHPAHTLDYRRFVSDTLLELYRAERDVIRAVEVDKPVTTNFMGFFRGVDYRSWAGEIDVISDDSYPDPADPEAPLQAALTHDLMRSLAGGPWLLMEQATSAVNWRSHNVPKTTARMRQDALRAIAHGADGVLSFQWRASPTGPERFHSAMLPHAGTDTCLHRAVQDLGRDLRTLAEVAGSAVRAEVAILFDWSSWWAAEEPGTPSDRLRVLPQLQAWYRPLWEAGIGVDVVHPHADLSRYRLVLAPQLYLLDDDGVANLRCYITSGGCLALGPFSAVADGNARVRTGRFPVPFAELLGAGGEEWWPLPEGGAGLVPANSSGALGRGHADTWAEHLRLEAGGICELRFEGGDLDGEPALVRSADDSLHYLATMLDAALLKRWILGLAARRGVVAAHPVPEIPEGVEVAQRGEFTLLINHRQTAVDVPLTTPHLTMLDELEPTDHVHLPPGGSTVLRRALS
ncbi:beta-galactosidase [Pseudactinotalea sp.]|uniref:beta-galactosidase n=1 Tax=Pseudactinotalea sp. TaxID=1926260 RepID=UPI003B3BA5B6